MHVASDIPPAAVPMMQERISPGEQIHSVLNWNMTTPNPGLGTFVVTNSSLWIFAFRKRRGTFSIRSAQQFPLKDLQYAGDSAAALAALGELRRQGLLDDSDWERAKALMLGKRTDEQRQAVDLLRQLHGLMEGGVISRGEFDMKKWEILSRRG